MLFTISFASPHLLPLLPHSCAHSATVQNESWSDLPHSIGLSSCRLHDEPPLRIAWKRHRNAPKIVNKERQWAVPDSQRQLSSVHENNSSEISAKPHKPKFSRARALRGSAVRSRCRISNIPRAIRATPRGPFTERARPDAVRPGGRARSFAFRQMGAPVRHGRGAVCFFVW